MNKKVDYLTFQDFIDSLDCYSNDWVSQADLEVNKKTLPLEVLIKKMQKFLEKQKKQKKEDFEVAEDGRITKINNRESEKNIYFVDNYNKQYLFSNKENVDDCIDCGLVYATPEARDRAMFKLQIETKLKNIAERLNGNEKIDWNNNKMKWNIAYNCGKKELLHFCTTVQIRPQGSIYCLDENFLYVAKQEIGEENLIKYFEVE